MSIFCRQIRPEEGHINTIDYWIRKWKIFDNNKLLIYSISHNTLLILLKEGFWTLISFWYTTLKDIGHAMSSLNLMMVQLKHTQSDIHIFFLPNLKQITCIEYPCTQLSLNNSFASNLRPSDGLQVQPKKEISHMVIPLQRKLYTYTLRNPKLFVLFTLFFFPILDSKFSLRKYRKTSSYI